MRQTEKYVENQAYKFTYRKKGCQEYNAKVCICHNFFLDLQHEIERKMDQLNTLKKNCTIFGPTLSTHQYHSRIVYSGSLQLMGLYIINDVNICLRLHPKILVLIPLHRVRIPDFFFILYNILFGNLE